MTCGAAAKLSLLAVVQGQKTRCYLAGCADGHWAGWFVAGTVFESDGRMIQAKKFSMSRRLTGHSQRDWL
jgi:hypothetical protein